MKKSLKIATSLCLFGAVGANSAFATGSSATKTVKQVEYLNTPTPNLYIQLNESPGWNYQATATYAPCTGVNAPNIETVKIWVSLGQAALLSGKTVTVYWNDCGNANGPRWITDVVLTA